MELEWYVGKCYIHNSSAECPARSIRKFISCTGDKLYYDVVYNNPPFPVMDCPAKEYSNFYLYEVLQAALEIGFLEEITEEEYERIREEWLTE